MSAYEKRKLYVHEEIGIFWLFWRISQCLEIVEWTGDRNFKEELIVNSAPPNIHPFETTLPWHV